MYGFSIDIPFKGSQTRSNMRSKVTAVLYLHSGVIDTVMHVTGRKFRVRVALTIVNLRAGTVF
jgi:hypothetical protein